MNLFARFRLRSSAAELEQHARAHADAQSPQQTALAAPQPKPFDAAEFRREWSAMPEHWFPMFQRAFVPPQPLRDPLMQAIHQTQPNQVDRDSANVKHDAVRAARKAQMVPIAVAPYTSLHVARSGQALTLHAGAEVLPSDFIGEQTVQAKLNHLVDAGAVIALTEDEVARRKVPSTARYVVADGGSISCKRGIIDEGLVVDADDFQRGQLDLDNLVARGAVVDRFPQGPQAA
jgi:hypothetical protein